MASAVKSNDWRGVATKKTKSTKWFQQQNQYPQGDQKPFDQWKFKSKFYNLFFAYHVLNG